MISRSKNSINIIRLLEYILAVFVVLDGNSMYHSLAYTDLHLPVICVLISILLFIGCSNRYFTKKEIISYATLTIYFAVYFLLKISQVTKEAFLFDYVIGTPILFLIFNRLDRKGERDSLFFCIEDVVIILALISIILWTFGSVFHYISTNMQVTVTWGQLRTYSGYFGLQFDTTISNSFGKGLPINSGIFTEGPMFNLWLDIALAIELFLRKTTSPKKVCLLCVVIVTTLSTTGIMFIAFSLGLKYILSIREKMTGWKFLSVIIVAMALPIIIGMLLDVYALKVGTSSYSMRMQDYVAGYKVWCENPILGSGYGDLSELQKYVWRSQSGNKGFSNSISAILGTGGLWMFLIVMLSCFAPMFTKRADRAKKICFMACYILLIITVIFFARFVIAVFTAYGLSFLISGNKSQNEERKSPCLKEYH